MVLDDVNATNFVDARSFEIQKLEEEITKTTKKSQMFQRLPFHKRRRARNKHNKKGKVKKNNGKFLYYHKRFEMKKMYGTILPMRRRQKSDSFIYKSQNRGFFWVEKHKKVFLYKKSIADEHKEIDIQRVMHGGEEYEVINFEKYTIMIGFEDIQIKNHEFVKTIGTSISILKGNKEITGIDLDKYLELDDKKHANSKSLCFENCLVIPDDYMQKYKIIVQDIDLANIHHTLVNEGFIPLSIFEYFRLALENNQLVYPFDYPLSKYYREFEYSCYNDEKEKWERTPQAKRINYKKTGITDPWFLPNNYVFENRDENIKVVERFKSYDTVYFDVKKGNVKRMGKIIFEDNCVGYVLRGSFCFTTGRSRGIAIIANYSAKHQYYLQKPNSLQSIEIIIRP